MRLGLEMMYTNDRQVISDSDAIFIGSQIDNIITDKIRF